MTDLSPRARDVLASARAELAPDADRIARGRERLLAATAITAATAVGVTSAHAAATASTASTASTGVAGLKLVALGASLVVVVAGALVVPRLLSSDPARSAARSEAPARHAMPAPDRAVPTATAIDGDDAIDPTMIEIEPNQTPPIRRTRPRDLGAAPAIEPAPGPADEAAPADEVAPVTAPAPAAIDPLTRELQLLRSARAGLRGGATVEGLSILAAYQREFPHGQLAEEAAALELDLLCAAGRTDAVDRDRARFLDRWPSSALRQRVERVCRPR